MSARELRERTAMDELRSLLGVWLTDSPTWPPTPGIQKALQLLERVERDHLESTAVYMAQIKSSVSDGCRTCHRNWNECIC